ncbi:uncharacterized protein BKCO1_7100041 [Diplodia corticola]|uniref:Uncharacterized protein n=1 Tax=Diplodia corticola TaxID=236234 RepID=A0A1J9RQK0_9PEZI|nr:uncharacterized protein BKCO1_7100041 [Diplodia corticola]OJD29829.1 hypothetical protein BKCO1_7100041 [Diplodia corticola]
MSPTDPIVSTGRGGAGNIGRDPTVYTDGEIVREGIQGEPERPGKDYSTGRGGAGNIGSPRLSPQPNNANNAGASATSQTGTASPATRAALQQQQQAGGGGSDVIPETALRQPGAGYENFHTGRGGEGNVHREKYGGHSSPQPGSGSGGEGRQEGGGLGEKVKSLFHKDKGEKKV